MKRIIEELDHFLGLTPKTDVSGEQKDKDWEAKIEELKYPHLGYMNWSNWQCKPAAQLHLL